MRDDNPDDVALPPNFTKRQLYAKWCWSRGHKVVMKSRSEGIYDTFTDRPNDDESEIPLWPTGSQKLRICSWALFLDY